MSHYNCCVPHCTNSFRNAPYMHYYRISKDPDVRKKYLVLIRNEKLKVNSESTRICSAHFDGGEKLSRTHLPSIFPWTKQMVARRELKRVSFEETQKMEQTNKYQSRERNFHLRITLTQQNAKILVNLLKKSKN